MTTAMGPPPPRIPTTTNSNTTTTSNTELQPETLDDEPSPAPSVPAPMNTAPMGPPAAPVNPNPSITDANQPKLDSDPQSFEVDHGKNSTTEPNDVNSIDKQEKSQNVGVPYTIPPWSEAPRYQYSFEVLKDGSIVDQFYVYEKGAYMFGRVDLCDFVLEHPTISRFHAVLQFNKNGDAFLYDLSSTHGTFVNKNQVKKKVYVELHVGDVIRFGHSSRLYIFQGPTELMPPEKDLTNTRKVKIREEMEDMEASLRRAELEASMADGISWGMDEDAIEENEDEIDEITWQTYKGQLTEKQEKTRDKVLKRLEKVANMKKEIDAIRVKDISQGGLTQGQQTQIARNEQRILQIVEELENLEETLNESIRESLGARSGRPTRGKKKGATEDDEDDYMSDDDEFYDRAKKKMPKQKGSENQSIETAGSLLDKKDVIIKEMEDKKKLLLDEKGKTVPENEPVAEAGDALDAYMSGLSTQLVLDKTEQLQKELDTLQSELDRILYLLKIADPTGEATRKRESKPESSKPEMSKTTAPTVVKKSAPEQNKRCGAEETVSGSVQNQGVIISNVESGKRPKECEIVADAGESRTAVYTDVKPQRLGAIEDREVKQQIREETLQNNNQEGDQFVDYKDWKKVLGKLDADLDLGIANAPPGLLIRKRKLPEKSDVTEVKASEQSTSSSEGEEFKAKDAVALLLKHTRGYHASDDEVKRDNEDMAQGNQLKKGVKKPKKVIGPERPSFLGNEGSYDESWVPPQGQSGDGRTSLNERYGY